MQLNKNHPDGEVERWNPLPSPVHLNFRFHLNLIYRIVKNDSCNLHKFEIQKKFIHPRLHPALLKILKI